MSSERQQPESGMGFPGGPAWNVAWSYAMLRFTLGTTFLMHGITRFVSGWSAFADQIVQSFHDTFLPDFMVRPFAMSVPPVEAILGILLCLGLFTRLTLIASGLWMVALVFGRTIRQDYPIGPCLVAHGCGLQSACIGRLTEAVEPMQVSLKMSEDVQAWKEAAGRARNPSELDATLGRLEDAWKEAANRATNLSELEVTLGRLAEAVADARRAVEFADRSGDAFQKVSKRTTVADALHQAGERSQAETLFAEAERMQAKDQPQFPLLYSLDGFQYVDLLLDPAERAAWQALLRGAGFQLMASVHELVQGTLPSICADAEWRAKQTLLWVTPQNWLLDIALDHLTIARARLYGELLAAAPKSEIENLQSEMRASLAKLRQANALNHLPKALLTAALYFGGLAGQPDEARRHLAEAQQIAERGPMPLYLADVHLHRARLFRDKAELAKARALIEKHGYWRRKEELTDADAAIGAQ